MRLARKDIGILGEENKKLETQLKEAEDLIDYIMCCPSLDDEAYVWDEHDKYKTKYNKDKG